METMPVNGKFSLIPLPCAPDALQPVISSETIGFHHGKHLQTYVNNLNAAIEGTKYAGLSLEEIIRTSDGGIFNNAGQILNHNLYFTQFRAPADSRPSGPLAAAIEALCGSFDAFKEEFVTKGAGLFGSGWVWLAADKDGKLQILQCPNADNPVAHGLKPLLTFDVWEHAYYLDYQNRRPDHLKALWSIVDWKTVESRY